MTKQDRTISDATAAIRIFLWEEHTNTFKLDELYLLNNITVREYLSTKHLSYSDEVIMQQISDIGEVVRDDCTDDDEEERGGLKTVEGEIIAVNFLEDYNVCIS